jgi:DNA repair protein RecN (Recombination protein N)
MLEYLRIQDLALIEDMELEFGPGVNVLSGETGAGKSFILKALNFLTGDRLEADLVRPGKEKASAEAIFTLPDSTQIVLRRELVSESGRSRLFINDRLSSQESVRELKPALLLHTSQHGQQKLLLPAFQSKILDNFLDRPDLLAQREEILNKFAELAQRRAEVELRFRSLEEKRDLLEFQRQEIDKINPREGEEEELEAQRQELRQADVRNGAVEQALSILHGRENTGLLDQLAALERAVRPLAGLDDSFAADLEAITGFYPALADLSARLRKDGLKKSSVFNSEAIEARLFALAQLKRKLRRSLGEILSLREELNENLAFLDGCALDLKQLARDESALCAKLAALLQQLNPARREAAAALKLLLEAELRQLGFSDAVQVDFVFSGKELYSGHSDVIEEKAQIFWRPNPGQTAQPLDKIASGGELSRFLLALVSILSRRMAEAPTLIFDEVDAGVGGITLNKLADKLYELGAERQLILITHWPNLAAKAGRHFLVRKEVVGGDTFTRCERLEGPAVAEELARMGGGGEQGRVLARGLLRSQS